MTETYRQRTQHLRGTLQEWESAGEHIIPLEGELVIEIDETNKYKPLHKLKIGDGQHKYSDLAYLMAGDEIVSQVLPRVVSVTLNPANWTEDGNGYCQEVEFDNITPQSRLDLQPTIEQIDQFKRLGIILSTANENKTIDNMGKIKIYSNIKIYETYEIQASIVETLINSDSVTVVGTPIIASASTNNWIGTPAKSLIFETEKNLNDWISDYINFYQPVYKSSTDYTINPINDGRFDVSLHVTHYIEPDQLNTWAEIRDCYETYCTIDLPKGRYVFNYYTPYNSGIYFQCYVSDNFVDQGGILDLSETQSVEMLIGVHGRQLDYSTPNTLTYNDCWIQINDENTISYNRNDGIIKKDLNIGDIIIVEENCTSYYWNGSELSDLNEKYYTKTEIDNMIGDVETILNAIVEEQEVIISAMDALIGGDNI